MLLSILQTAAETALAGAFVWAARTLVKTQGILAPRLDANTAALHELTEVMRNQGSPEAIIVGFQGLTPRK